MAAVTLRRSILVVGKQFVAGNGPKPNFPWTDKDVEDEMQRADKMGLDIVMHLVDTDSTTYMNEFRQVLQRVKQPDTVVIGFGIRGDAELTPIFEQLVNAVVREVQPVPKLAFALRPDRIVEAIERVS